MLVYQSVIIKKHQPSKSSKIINHQNHQKSSTIIYQLLHGIFHRDFAFKNWAFTDKTGASRSSWSVCSCSVKKLPRRLFAELRKKWWVLPYHRKNHRKTMGKWWLMVINGDFMMMNPWFSDLPSGKLTVCYWKWPSRNSGFTDLPNKNSDFP